MKHTPGPWHVDPTHKLCIESARNGNVGIVNLARASEGDATLMAAAPELASLLQEAENMAAIGDIDETTEAYGWGAWMTATRIILARIGYAPIKEGKS